MYVEFIVIFKAVDASLSIKWKTGLIPRIFKFSFKPVKDRIISFPLLYFIAVFSIALQSYKY